jgi:hypothetical protein
METVVDNILESMSNVKKRQRSFLKALFTVLMVFQGRATFRNMSHYTKMSEKSFSRWYHRNFDFSELMARLLPCVLPEKSIKIAAIDARFISKSRKTTEG